MKNWAKRKEECNFRIKIIIPNSKESERLPNKNRTFRHYTLDFIEQELKAMPKAWQFEIDELRNQKVDVDTSADAKYSFKINPVFCPDEASTDLKPLLAWYEEQYNIDSNDKSVDFVVLLQLTQPRRKKGLLFEALDKVMTNDGYLCTSYTVKPFTNAWRVIDERTNTWNETKRNEPEPHLKLYDGAIYAWANFNPHTINRNGLQHFFIDEYYNSKLLWNKTKYKHLIQNGFETVIDIDTYEDAQLFYQTQGD